MSTTHKCNKCKYNETLINFIEDFIESACRQHRVRGEGEGGGGKIYKTNLLLFGSIH